MHANDLTTLATAIERRAKRAIDLGTACTGLPCGNAELHAELCRKLIADELQSEWLRMHSARRPKKGELALLVRMFGQLAAAVQEAVAGVEPAAMPAAAAGAVTQLAASKSR